jgi:hypothetical protein
VLLPRYLEAQGLKSARLLDFLKVLVVLVITNTVQQNTKSSPFSKSAGYYPVPIKAQDSPRF